MIDDISPTGTCFSSANLTIDFLKKGAVRNSLCLKSNLTSELTLLMSSLGAAQSIESLANKDTISKMSILKTLENILK